MEGPSRHMCKGHMDKDKRGNLRVGGGDEWWGENGENST